MFCEGAHLEPKVPKRRPRGAPGRVFGHLLTTFWNTLASLSPPAATLRPHFDTVVKKVRIYAYLLYFGSIRDPSQPVNLVSNGTESTVEQPLCAVIARELAAFFSFCCLLCFCPFFKPEGLDARLEGKIQS